MGNKASRNQMKVQKKAQKHVDSLSAREKIELLEKMIRKDETFLDSLVNSCDGDIRIITALRDYIADPGVFNFYFKFNGAGASCTDFGLQVLAMFLPDVEHLNIADNQRVSDSGIKYLADRCKSLEILIASNTGIGNGGFQYVAKKCKQLKCVEASNTQLDQLGALMMSHERKHLKYIVATHLSPDLSVRQVCELITDRAPTWQQIVIMITDTNFCAPARLRW